MADEIITPKGEIVWERIYSGGQLIYLVTSKPARDFYILYKFDSGILKKLGKARTPVELREKYCKEEF